jgi:hypothetical protein
MKNYQNVSPSDTLPKLSLMISAKTACTGTIENPVTGWSMPFSVPAGELLKVTVDKTHCYNENSDVIESKGLYITSTDTISLFASNLRDRSFDITNVLPVATLSDEYIIQTYDPALFSGVYYGGEFVIIADEDNTTVDITPTADAIGGKSAGVAFSITLDRGKTYQLRALGSTGNFSGTYIKSRDCKKIAVFNGNDIANVPAGEEASDHLFEQAVPVAYWGKAFAITSSMLRKNDRIIITASKDNTDVFLNGSQIAALNARESYETELSATDGSCFVETSEPSAVYLYLTGKAHGNLPGDPSMVWISPVEQKIREVTFGTYNTNEIEHHYVNVVVATSDKNTVTLDGVNIGSKFSPLQGNAALSFAQLDYITSASHTLRSSKGITAHVYGLGYNESYAYSVGSAMDDLQRTIWINDEQYSLSAFADKYICIEHLIKFYVTLNYQYESISWNFGDGNTGTGDTVYHAYQNPGTYQVIAVIERTMADPCSGNLRDTVTAQINITDYTPKTEFHEEICIGKTYNNHGHVFVAVQDTLIIDTVPTAICDSFVYIYVYILPEYSDTISATVCLGENYNDNGFNVTPTVTGLITQTRNLTSHKGCDSIVTLQLNVISVYNVVINDTICLGGSYNDNGFDTIPEAPGLLSWTRTLVAVNHCDSVITLKLMVWQSYNDTIQEFVCSNNTSIPQWTIIGDTTIPGVSIHGCDSTVTIQYVHSYNYSNTVSDTVCFGERYQSNGFNIMPSATGLIHDSIKLSSIHGCDSIIFLNLTVLQSYNDTIYDTICFGYRYDQHGFDTLPEQAGNYIIVHESVAINGCDSLLTLNLVVHPVYYETRIIEPGDGSGIYCDDTIFKKTIYGCDSIIYIDYIGPPLPGGSCGGGGGPGGPIGGGGGDGDICSNDTINAEICLGKSYNENGFNLMPDTLGTGTYWRFIPDTVNECDSLITLLLEVLPFYNDTVLVTVCSSDTNIQAGTVLYDSIAALTTVRGCDSIIVYRHIHQQAYYDTIQAEICSNEEYHNDICNFDIIPEGIGDFIYSQTHTAMNGCDSIITLLLTVKRAYDTVVEAEICTNERYYNEYYNFDTIPTQPGIINYSRNLTTADGCDSIITLHLTVWQSYDDTIKHFVCSSDTSIAQGTIISSSTTDSVSIHNCDSTVTVQYIHCYTYNDTITDTVCQYNRYSKYNFDETPTVAGVHYYKKNLTTFYYSCDSTVTLQLTVNPVYNNTIYDTICQYEAYSADGFVDTTINQAGNYIFVNSAKTVNNCDSITTLRLTVNPVYDIVLYDTACSGAWYSMQGFDFLPSYAGDTILVHNDTTSKGCDSVTTLRLTVYPSYHDSIEVVICTNAFSPLRMPFTPSGNFETEESSVDPPPVLMDYSITQKYTTIHGCDSIITLLYNFYPSYADTIRESVCINENYDNYDFYIEPDSTGTFIYSRNLKTYKGCDSITTLVLTVKPAYDNTIYDTICQYGTYIDHNFKETVNQSGDYTFINVDTTQLGCDSITTLLLRVKPVYLDTIYDTICQYGTYINHNFEETVNQSGDYTFINVDTTQLGCDSITTLLLRVNPVYNDTIWEEICLGKPYENYYFDTLPVAAGIVVISQYLKTVNGGCDSTVTLHLTVHPVYYDTINAEICLNDTYNNYNFIETPTYTGTHVFVNSEKTVNGCDSITTLLLTVYPVYDYTISATICLDDTYDLNGFNITPAAAGIFHYTKNLSTVNGCDSIVNLQLTVNPSYRVFIIDTIYEDEWRYVGQAKYNTPGIHITYFKTNLDCDSVVTLDLYVIYYPPEITAFSPFNRDGINDYLHPGFKVQIFNRYGAIIYETKTREEQALGWDGRNSRGHMVEPGLYFYILYNSSGKPRIKSSVEVLKR